MNLFYLATVGRCSPTSDNFVEIYGLLTVARMRKSSRTCFSSRKLKIVVSLTEQKQWEAQDTVWVASNHEVHFTLCVDVSPDMTKDCLFCSINR